MSHAQACSSRLDANEHVQANGMGILARGCDTNGHRFLRANALYLTGTHLPYTRGPRPSCGTHTPVPQDGARCPPSHPPGRGWPVGRGSAEQNREWRRAICQRMARHTSPLVRMCASYVSGFCVFVIPTLCRATTSGNPRPCPLSSPPDPDMAVPGVGIHRPAPAISTPAGG